MSITSSGLLTRLNELFAALASGDPADIQDVQNLRNEIAGLDESAYLPLIDPIWNKISARFPETVDKEAAKIGLLKLIKAIGSARYDPELSELRAIRRSPEFIALARLIESAAGENITFSDFLIFFLGDGGGRKGIEGTLVELLSSSSPWELAQLLADQKRMTTVLLQATGKVLGETDSYKLSSLLTKLGVTSEDVGAVVRGFQLKLKKDEPAINALMIAYIRTIAKSNAIISEDGLEHRYSLSIFGTEVPSLVVQWTKISGSPDVSVMPDGIVTIPRGVESASAVIQAKLVNPLTGVGKVILEQAITLTAAEEEGDVFPIEQFLERRNKLNAALLAGNPDDAQAVRNLRDEIAGLDVANNQALIDPIWNRIAPRLPDSIDQAQLKASLFEIVKAVGAMQYNPQLSELEAIRTNPEYRATLKTIATAARVKRLTIDDYLIFLFGDGAERKGVEGAIVDIVADMKPRELAELLDSTRKRNAVRDEAIADILAEREDYALSAALNNLGVGSADVRSAIRNFEDKLKNEVQATLALSIAYIRSEAIPTVKVTANGRQHQYGLTVLDVEIPSSVVRWKKVSGSKDVKVDSNGKVTIPKNVAKGTAVIQAVWNNYGTRNSRVLFEQEVTLVNEDMIGGVEEIVQAFNEKLDEIKTKLDADPNDEQKVQLLLEVILLGKDTVNQINEADAPKAVKKKAIDTSKKQVSRLVSQIIQDLMDF
ncbi:hypothetical protein HH215_32555 [Cohnella herbarum]|uniref:Uncharacterized protein n=2 Tax=Cohnella herbarum TaxID=2728023 RepID=A0A7Z2VQM6_9BACL|nr:hypothetical protein HH215_32555 [Cohnella herbarum]